MFSFSLVLGPTPTNFNCDTIRRSASMAELTDYSDNSLYSSMSNEHILFASTLRNWSDPLLQGQQSSPVILCPRCVSCKCESLKDLPHSSTLSTHHLYHDPNCPNFRQHERSKTLSRQSLINKPKRRANSCEPILPFTTATSMNPSENLQRKKSVSQIPVRISSATSSTSITTASEHSTTSSNAENMYSKKSKIPRPITKSNSFSTHPILSSSEDDLDQDRYDK